MKASFARFGRFSSSISRDIPLTNDELRKVAPSIFAEAAHDSRSARYSYVPTLAVLDGLRREGFQPFSATQSRCRTPGKAEFTKHMMRLRHADQITTRGEVPEVILINSHDGTSSYQMMAGMFRFVCSNGMIAGNMQHNIKIPHKGDIVGNVIDGAFEVVKDFDAIAGSVDGMKALTLSAPEQSAFAAAALELRFDTSEQAAPIQAERLLTPHRMEDRASDLWTTFNRVQENVIRGGVHGRAATGRRMSTREISGIDQNVKMNRALWVLAEQMKAIKTA